MTIPQLVNGERTKDMYEELPWYPKPPLIPLPEFDYLISAEHSGIQYGRLPKWLIRGFWAIIGLRSLYRELSRSLEQHLRAPDASVSLESGIVQAATMTLDHDPRNPDPLERATALLFALHNLYEDLTSGNFEPDRHQGQVLEVGQYFNLFSTSFIVDGGRARIFKSAETSQITVIVGGGFYCLRTGTPGRETTFRQLKEALTEIVERARQKRTEAPSIAPGILTCARSSTQHQIFSKLQEQEVNARSLFALRHSMAVLCLDLDSYPSSPAEAALAAHSRNCGNRWFHSSLQIVVFGNGSACLIAHPVAFLPGNTMMRAAHEIQGRALQYPAECGGLEEPGSLSPARELEWEIDPEFLARARQELVTVLDQQQATFDIPGLDKDLLAACELSSVPVFVIALQMAIKRLTGRISVIRQFLDLSKYRCMSLVTTVVTTAEVIDFVEYLERGEAASGQAVTRLRKAVDSQLLKCRIARKFLSFSTAFGFFVKLSGKSNRRSQRLRMLVAFWLGSLFSKWRLIKFTPIEILISHPKIYSDVSIVGRPGVRLPFVRDLGLHYQIHDRKIVITVMPSINWTIPNRDLIVALQESLVQIQNIITQAADTGEAPR
jgi:choline/carnitine o-acyltransferase